MDSLQIERGDDGIVTVTLNRPEKKNAINGPMWTGLREIFEEVRSNSDHRAMVLTGAGGEFCSGADLTASRDDPRSASAPPMDGMRNVADTILALHRIPKPTIAKVDGVAAGGGCNLALGCDLIVASDRSRFVEIFPKRGLTVDCGGSWLLPRLIGLHKAKELAFFGDLVSTDEAMAMGLVNRVVPAAEIHDVVDDWARRLASGPTVALSLTKTLLNNAFHVSMGQALEDEGAAQTVNRLTHDTAEARAAFLEKRAPEFQGR